MSHNLARTPPAAAAEQASHSEERLREHYRIWRRNLHKAKDYRVKVLRVLAQDGDAEAGELLGDPPRAYGAARCKLCSGCLLMAKERGCGSCRGCQGGRGCEEHHRRCRSWPRNCNTYHDGSEITAISSQYDLLSADLSKYEAIIEVLREVDVEMEEDLDRLPLSSLSRTNPRFQASGRAKELEDERQHHGKLTAILRRHSEILQRLDEVQDEPERTEEHQAPPEENLTATQTSRQLIGMFGQVPTTQFGSPVLPTTFEAPEDEQADLSDSVLDSNARLSGRDNDWGFGDLGEREPTTPNVVGDTESGAANTQNPVLGGRRPSTPVPGIPVVRPALPNEGLDSSRAVGANVPQPGGPRLIRPRMPAAVFPPAPPVMPASGRAFVPGICLAAPVIHPRAAGPPTRRRSQSNEFVATDRPRTSSRVSSRQLEDKFFELDTRVRTRRAAIATKLKSVQDVIEVSARQSSVPVKWVSEQVESAQRALDETEEAEAEVWSMTARLSGPQARRARANEWATWHQRAISIISTVQASIAMCPSATAASTTAQAPTVGVCQRRGGYLERVKLPSFSGSVEDFGEFRAQFQELCHGENYTDVIELAQLRQKLPKEAVSLLVGITTAAVAWSRLEETYGNKEMQIFAALKRLRNLKLSKTASHDRVIELANGVQRCVTVLAALAREDALLHDRETFTEIINLLPPDSQQRWYHRRGARSETQLEKGKNFLTWLEEERADAVAIHLDALAR